MTNIGSVNQYCYDEELTEDEGNCESLILMYLYIPTNNNYMFKLSVLMKVMLTFIRCTIFILYTVTIQY